MTKVFIAVCLAAVAMAQDAKVTPLVSQDLAGIAGKEATMATVEYAPGGSSKEHRHNAVMSGSATDACGYVLG
jgi:quercetin dioxygenase-like cupin family protein